MGEHHQNSQTVQKMLQNAGMRAGSKVPFFTEKLTRKSPKNLLFVGQCLFIFSQTEEGPGRGSIAAIF
jgi:hypothetical protein